LQLFRIENEKITWFFAFSPKATKSFVLQAGLLTYPLFIPFPLLLRNSGCRLKSYSGITAAGTVQELPFIGSPVSLLILQIRNLLAGKVIQKIED